MVDSIGIKMIELNKIVDSFDFNGSVKEIVPFGEGHINSTYKVTVENNKTAYVLQKINHHIFKDVDLLQNNIKRITDHIRAKLTEKGETEIDRKTLTIIPARDGKLYYFDGEDYWRMMLLIADSYTFDVVSPEYALCAGRAFGEFQLLLSDLPGEPLGETIPDFHNMEFRLVQFREAVAADVVHRLNHVKALVGEVEQRATEMCICQTLYKEGKLPKRINHCDTKVNNMLFDKEGNVLCVIDLDTVMPGFVVSDIGDFMRTAGNTGKEDDENLDQVSFNMEIYRAYTTGYLEVAGEFLTPLEIELLPFGAKLMTYMQLVRFLTDYLNGDVYYKIHYPEHNLQRSKAQYKLLSSIEENYEAMQVFVRKNWNV
jgi:hypothetical protein